MANHVSSTDGLSLNPWVDDPIAIVGIGLRLPGSVRTPQQFWEFLKNKRSGRCRVPKDRYNVDAFIGPEGKPGHVCTDHGYYLDLDLAAVDSSFWSMSPKELALLDPQQRLMMEVVYECLESSGAATYRGKDIGLYVGAFGEDWMDIQTKDSQHPGMHYVTGYGDFAIANRVSKELGLTGPSMTIRTACSSSLMALHAACQALYAGDCSSAVVGGCNLILSPRMTTTMSELGVLSPQGNCRSFDARADGYARGEAVNAIHIKRLSYALRDGDPIRSVIRSVCINSDGPRTPLYIPSPESHELLIRRSHQLAGITDLSQTAMIECHGTGTTVDDIQEGRAVAKVFGEFGGVLIGSVKPNMGHSEGASGLTSIIKMVLALENRTIPPNINFSTPNTKIPFGAARIRVPVECEPWPKDKAERVGLNGFGIGGANGHVLLESTRSFLGTASETVAHCNKPQLLVFSGTHGESVGSTINKTLEHLNASPDRIPDASYTLAHRRQILSNRSFAVGTIESWDIFPVQKAGPPPNTVWVFTGQGAQYPRMGQELLEHNNFARDTIRQLDAVLYHAVPGRSWTIEEELSQPEHTTRLAQPEFSQPCCTALQIALVDVLKSLKVKPAAVVGHSAGEIAAAYAAGALTAAEAILISYHRGRIASRIEMGGGMMAVSLGTDQVSPYLTHNVTIACENSSKNVTLSGNSNALDAVAADLQSRYPDVSIKRIPVPCAYHSDQMVGPAAEYLERLENTPTAKRDKQLSTVFISTVTGSLVQNKADLNSHYWTRNLTSPVLFSSAVSRAVKAVSYALFLEIGPHSVLSGPLREIAPSVPHIPTLVRGADAYISLLRTAGRLFQSTDIDLSTLCKGKTLADLPPYQWHHTNRFWSESRVSRNWRFRQHAHHDILGSQIPDGNDTEPLWRSVIYLENVPWLSGHVMDDRIVFPRAAYIAMAGEAIRQLTGQADYSLRQVDFCAEIEVKENQALELLTQFRPSRQPGWYEFTITSHADEAWKRICAGQARGGQDRPLEVSQVNPGSRKIKENALARAMVKLGVKHGPRIRGLEKIAANITSSEATAEIEDTRGQQESSYSIHPCTIDSIIQLFNVANARGHQIDHLTVPTYVGEINVRPSSGSLAVHTTIHSTQSGVVEGEAAGFCDGNPVLFIENIQLSLAKRRDSRGPDPHAGARLVWQPDIDAADLNSLITQTADMSDSLFLVEELAVACMIESEQHVPNDATPQHLVKYHQWLGMQRKTAEKGEYRNIESCQAIASMSSTDRKQYIDKLYQAALNTPARDVATAVFRICHESVGLFEGTVDALNLLHKDNLLSAVYGFQLCDLNDFFRLFAHNRPCMKVLEIGAGTGGLTATILPALHSLHAERLYKSYTYTDISPGFFGSAQERFKDYDGITYCRLDITADIAGQGFDASYDLIIASNVLHATPDLQKTLAYVKSLMKPGGKLFLQELAPVTKWINYVMGILPGWWLSTDGRPWEPYVSPKHWDAELRAAGMSGADAVVHDGQMNAHIVSSLPNPRSESSRKVTVLCNKDSKHSNALLDILQADAFNYDIRYLGDNLPSDQLVISILELDGPQLHQMTEDKYLQLRNLIPCLDKSPMLWVTRSSQVGCSDPRYAATLGLLRTARRELGLTVATLELDTVDNSALQAVITVAKRVLGLQDSQDFDPVIEYAYSCDSLMIGKFYPANVGEELLDSAPPENDDSTALVLQTENAREVSSMKWKTKPLTMPSTEDDWVAINTRAIGINAAYSISGEATGLCTECTGFIQRVGPGVKNLRVGDRVIALSCGPGEVSTRIITSEKLCVRMARGLNWVEGATMARFLIAALYSLVDVARLKSGDNVLIDSAGSTVGLATIQVCRIIGAQAICTVKNNSQNRQLQELGVPENRIYEMHSSALTHEILKATKGRGVDVVLNSYDGDQHALWECVAEFGTLIDFTRCGSRFQAPVNGFGGNRTYAAVDVDQLIAKRPEVVQGLLRRCMHHYALGELSPLPAQELPVENIELALRRASDDHVGESVIVISEDVSSLPVTLLPKAPAFQSDAIHIIIGGLGGLGRSISSWMACHGARHFVFFSPSAGSKENDDFVLELRAQGCRVDLVSGDVSKEENVDSLIAHLNPETPIAGIIQASMALDVNSLAGMSFSQWTTSFAPKVNGTWNIHNSLLKYRRRTSYFLLLSSISGLIGQTGHANYAAGNAFLDAFVQYRHSLGLPCSSLNTGVMEDVGYVSEQPHIVEHFAATGTHALQERDLLDAVQLAIENSLPPLAPVSDGDQGGERERAKCAPYSYVNHSQLVIGLRSTNPLDSPTNRIAWRRDPRMALYHNFNSNKADTEKPSAGAPNANDTKALNELLTRIELNPKALADEASAETLGREAGKALFSLMLRDHAEIELDASLASLGADSLLAIKLTRWFHDKIGVDINVVQILGSESLRELGRTAAKALMAKKQEGKKARQT
ncbi:type I polyketide synthase [Aspergillus stella-maris]|uniref:type I polyketide synthase n=1 Tax=Aspergillus stella-maris TaxID=1810926 RepID=UPI003CCD4608